MNIDLKQIIRKFLIALIAFSFSYKIHFATIPMLTLLLMNVFEKKTTNNYKTKIFLIFSVCYFSLFLISWFLEYNIISNSLIKNSGFIFIPLIFIFYDNIKLEKDKLFFNYFFIFFIFLHSLYLISISIYLSFKTSGNIQVFNDELINYFIIERPYYSILVNIATVISFILFRQKKVKNIILIFLLISINFSLLLIAAKVGVFLNIIIIVYFLSRIKNFRVALLLISIISIFFYFENGGYISSRFKDISNDPRELIWKCNLKLINEPKFDYFIGNFSNEITEKQLEECYNTKESLESKYFWIGKYNYKYNSHNQYLSVFSNFGIIGLSFYLLMLLLPISNKKDSNLIIFIFILSSVFENILDRQLGIYSFLWFSFLSINRATNNEIKLYVNGRFLTQKTTGVQRVAYEVVSRLQKIYGDKLVVLIPSNKKIEDSKLKNFNIEKIGFFNNFLWEQVELPLYLKRKESILLLNLCNSQPIMSRKINITVLHDVAFARESKWFTKKFKFWYLFMTKLTLHKNIAIITVSNFSKKEIIDKYSQVNSQKINVVYLASFLEPNFEIINNLTEKYFLSVASYDPRKNLKTIINGFNKFCTKHDNVYLKLVGRKSSTFDEINLCSENKKIIFLEDVSDEELKNIYKKAIGFISASYYEGFGLPILESISQKTICLVSDIDVYREIFNDKVLYFNNNKSEDLEKLMEDVLFNDYNVIKEKLENFNLEFSWDKTAQNYFKIINDYHKF